MGKDKQTKLNYLRIILDAITIVIAYFLTFSLFFHVFPDESIFGGHSNFLVTADAYRSAIFYLLPIHLCIYALLRQYRYLRFTGRKKEAGHIFVGNLLSILIVVVLFWLFNKTYSVHFSRMFLFEFGFVNTILIVLERNLLRFVIRYANRKDANAHRVLAVGYSTSAEALIDRFKLNPFWGYSVIGILADHKPVGTKYKDVEVIGTIDELPKFLADNVAEEVYVTLTLRHYDVLERVVYECEKAGVMVKFVPDYGSMMSSHPYTEDLMGLPVIHIRKVPLDEMLNAFGKRIVDIIGASIAILLFSPIMIVTALLIKITSPGPLIFKQERVGLHNRPFMMYKFRSMKVQTEEEEKKKWTTKNDPRVTGIGRFIRKTSIDEMPQFFNVLFGDMSLVGPRPERPQFVEKFREEVPRYMVKHQVRPGITGWAQVNGFRGDTSIEGRIEHDIYYIENWSMGFDFKILFLTFFKGFVNKNAY